MTTATHTATTIQVYRVYIKATAQAIWDAITQPEWTDRHGYTGRAEYDLRPGGRYQVHANDEFKAQAEAGGFPCPMSSSTARLSRWTSHGGSSPPGAC